MECVGVIFCVCVGIIRFDVLVRVIVLFFVRRFWWVSRLCVMLRFF